MSTSTGEGRPDGKKTRWSVIAAIIAVLFLAYWALGCTAWRQAPFEIEARNSSGETITALQVNGRDYDGPIDIGRSKVFIVYLTARGVNYSTGPSQYPDCTQDIRIVGFTESGKASQTLSISYLCQDQSGFVEFFPRDF